jgi:hypothetical protein
VPRTQHTNNLIRGTRFYDDIFILKNDDKITRTIKIKESKMETIEQEHKQEILIRKITFDPSEEMNCLQVRKKLDELFSGDARLEETHAVIKRLLFKHLQVCQECCHSFDVRGDFCSPRRNRIY